MTPSYVLHHGNPARTARTRPASCTPPATAGFAPAPADRNLRSLEDRADGGCVDPIAGLKPLTLNPLVSPVVILGGEPLDQRGDLDADRRPSRPVRVGPYAGTVRRRSANWLAGSTG
jgi:hypothetical protein